MAKAIWEGTVLAESEKTVEVEGNKYFPPDTVQEVYLRPSSTRSVCAWKGTASYFDVEVNGEINKDAAWYYPEPKPAASNIKGHVAFWRGIKVEK